MSNSLNHIADLTFQSGVENQFESARRDSLYGYGARFANFCEDTLLKLSEDGVFEGVFSRYLIKFLNLVTWVSESLGKFAIITENHEALGIKIKATNVGEVMETRRKQFVNCRPVFFVVPGANQSGWLV